MNAQTITMDPKQARAAAREYQASVREARERLQEDPVPSGWCATNPAVALKPPKQRHQPTLPFEDAECQRLLDAIDRWRFGTGRWAENGRRVRALFLVLRYTGLRICDAPRLARAQVADGRVFLYQAKTGLPVNVPVPPEVTSALDALAGSGPYYFWRGSKPPSERQVEYAYQVWRRTLLALARHAHVPNATARPPS